MIFNAFSALGSSGKNKPLSSVWYLDSEVSYHTESPFANLSNITKYNLNLQVQTADGGNNPITLVMCLGQCHWKHVYLSCLTSNLLSVRQLVDNNCHISFSSSGSVQDQMSGKLIAREPNCGHLFPPCISALIRNKPMNDFFFFFFFGSK